MPFNPLPILAPIAGAFGSAALQQSYAQKNWDRVNAYNHPKEQIKRLKEAGLPLATMFGGQGGSTSSSIDTPNVDPSLGVAEGLQKGALFAMQKKQMAIMDQELRVKTAEADIKEDERNYQLGRTLDSSDGKNIPDFEPQFGDTNQVQGIRRERAIKEAELSFKGIENELRKINLNNAPEQIRAQIDHILQGIKIQGQQILRDENYSKMLDRVSGMIFDGPSGFKGLTAFIKAWFYKTMLR